MRRHFLCLLGFVMLVGVTTGCVTGTRSIAMPEPQFLMTESISRGSISIGQIADDRRFEDGSRQPATPSVRGGLEKSTPEQRARLIGRQRNGYGKAIGDIDLPNERTVQDEVRDLVSHGFAGRGYAISDSATDSMRIEIQKFWAWFQPGMWVIAFHAEVRTKLHITTPSGNHEITVEGRGENKGQVASDANWALAYQRAYDDYLENLESALAEAGL